MEVYLSVEPEVALRLLPLAFVILLYALKK